MNRDEMRAPKQENLTVTFLVGKFDVGAWKETFPLNP